MGLRTGFKYLLSIFLESTMTMMMMIVMMKLMIQLKELVDKKIGFTLHINYQLRTFNSFIFDKMRKRFAIFSPHLSLITSQRFGAFHILP